MQINRNYQNNLLWNNENKNEARINPSKTKLLVNLEDKKQKDSVKLSFDMSEKLRKLELEEKGIIDGDSLISTVKSNLGEIQSSIQKISDLVKTSQKSFVTEKDKETIAEEIENYQKEIDKISNGKVFDKLETSVTKLIDLTNENFEDTPQSEQWGNYMSILLSISNNSSESLGLNDINISTQEEAQKALNACKAAQNKISTQFVTLTKFQGILENIDLPETQNFLQGATSIDEILNYSKKLSKVHNNLSSNKLELYKLNYLYTNNIE